MGKFPGLHGNNLLLALTTCPRSLSLLAGLKPGNCNQSPGNSCYGASRTKAQVKSAGRQSEASGCGSPPEQTKTALLRCCSFGSGFPAVQPNATRNPLAASSPLPVLGRHGPLFSEPRPSPAPTAWPPKGGGTKMKVEEAPLPLYMVCRSLWNLLPARWNLIPQPQA